VKHRILIAAAQELNDRGVRFTVEAVAARLGISKKTLYQYYASKDALITAITDAVINDLTVQREAILASKGCLAHKITGLLSLQPCQIGPIREWVIEDFRRLKPAEWQKLEQFRREHVDILSRLLSDGQQLGHVRPVDSRVAAKMFYDAVTALFNTRFLQDNNLTFQQAIANITDIFLYGVLIRSEQTHDNAPTAALFAIAQKG